MSSVSAPDLTAEYCPLGHPKRRRDYDGRTECLTCRNAWRRDKRALERDGTCKHVTKGAGGFEGILSTRNHLVCIECLVAEANRGAAKAKNG